MKKFLSCKKVAVIFLAVTVIFLGIYVYMLARPISYGMGYHNVTEYNGGTFEGTIKLGANGIMVNKNTNFENAIETRYYYKNGYVFDLNATDDKGAEKEIDYINKNFETAIKLPFYASKINAFQFSRQVSQRFIFHLVRYSIIRFRNRTSHTADCIRISTQGNPVPYGIFKIR